MNEIIHPNRIGFTDQHPINILERFFNNLPAWPLCMAGLNQPSYNLSKDRAIHFPYIQLNKLRRAYICLDIDRPGAIFAHKEVGMPPPTIILVNPVNGHAHIFYELRNPVLFSGRSRTRPQKYFKAVQGALTFKFMADTSFRGFMVKNPFHNTRRGGKWEWVYNIKTYDLKDLASHVDLKNYGKGFPARVTGQTMRGPILKGARNVTVFDVISRFSYMEVRNHEEYETFSHTLRVYALSLNEQYCKPSLSESEVEYISRRVCEWTWDNRIFLRNHTFKKKGVMGFNPIPSDLNLAERQDEIKKRQRNGAKYTHSLRKQKTEKAIVKAIRQLKTGGKRVTKSAAGRLAGVSRETISRRYKHLFE